MTNIAATATKESWKPTSYNQTGLYNNIRNAADSSVFIDQTFSDCRPANAHNENIITDLTTEADNPVKKAKPHKNNTISNSSIGFNTLHRLHKGVNKKKSKAYMNPICSPESANPWLAPATE